MIAAAIAKAVLGGIGGGLSGAAKGSQSGQVTATEFKDTAEKIGKAVKDKISEEKPEKPEDDSAEDSEKKENLPSDSDLKTIKNYDSTQLYKTDEGGSGIGSILSKIKSDEDLKRIYGDSLTDELVEAFAKIDTADFTYKPEAQELYKDNPNMDAKEHVGILAQQLEDNPLTQGTVERDENGFLEVNPGHLTTENTAVIAELSRRILALEEIVKELQGDKE